MQALRLQDRLHASIPDGTYQDEPFAVAIDMSYLRRSSSVIFTTSELHNGAGDSAGPVESFAGSLANFLPFGAVSDAPSGRHSPPEPRGRVLSRSWRGFLRRSVSAQRCRVYPEPRVENKSGKRRAG